MKNALLCGLMLLGFATHTLADTAPNPVEIDYFFETGCPQCQTVSSQILPQLQAQYEGFYRLDKHDVGAASNLLMLVAYQDKLGLTNNCSVSLFLDYSQSLCGVRAIEAGLMPMMDRLIEARLTPGWQPPQPITWNSRESLREAQDRATAFTLTAVMIAGLIDGINPCAISTLVFFMSLLVTGGVKGRGLLLMAGAFALFSFMTYTAIGFGLLRSLHVLDAFPLARSLFEGMLCLVLIAFALLSFRDAYRYRQSQKAADVALQLPDAIKKRIHAVLRKGMRGHHLLLGGAAAGIVVTALETVCTGQVYVPTMTLVIREAGGAGVNQPRVWGRLLLYNTMFIFPLMIAIVLTRFGLTTPAMLKLSRKNVPFSKTLLGLFFLAMATYLLIA